MNAPNFFIVGGVKCGTTSLAAALNKHPKIFIPSEKEPHFFATDVGFKRSEEYLRLYRDASNAIALGDASTGYLYDANAGRRIREFDPNSKVIIMLRNPADAAFSLWQYMQVNGNETMSSRCAGR